MPSPLTDPLAHEPGAVPSSRQVKEARPEVASAAEAVKVTFERYHPLAARTPLRLAVICGGIESCLPDRVARLDVSVKVESAQKSKLFWPSASGTEQVLPLVQAKSVPFWRPSMA